MAATFDIARKSSPKAVPRADLKSLNFGRGTLNPERHAAPSGVACPCGGGCPRCQTEKQSSLANLQLSQPGDAAEHEADHVAEQVLHTPHTDALAQTKIKGKTDLRISRHPATSASGHSQNIPPIVHETLKSRGQALGADTRSTMEPRFGRSFAGVQIHTDATAAASADAVHARAYTVGPHVVFGRGQYDPSTLIGRNLLAHELTHVVQQSAHGAHALQRQPKQSSAPDPTAIDPKNLGTLGPAFQKPEAEVRKLGLKEKILADSTTDQDSVLFWAQNSTVPLRKLRSGTPVFLAGGVRGEKSLVWAYPEGETNMFMGFARTALLQDIPAKEPAKSEPPTPPPAPKTPKRSPTFTIHAKRPDSDSQTGHVWITLEDGLGDPHDLSHRQGWGLYPLCSSDTGRHCSLGENFDLLKGNWLPGAIVHDNIMGANEGAAESYPISEEKYREGVRMLEEEMQTDPYYNLYHHSCVQWAREKADFFGVKVPDALLPSEIANWIALTDLQRGVIPDEILNSPQPDPPAPTRAYPLHRR